MATLSAPALTGIYKALEASSQYGSMRRGGIVGDLAHKRRGGYHVSRQDQPSSNYSVQAPADKRGPGNLASGIDLTMSPADMRKMTGRLLAACKRNHADPSSEPRIEPVREFFGTLNGRSVTGWNRYPSANRSVGPSSSDSSHLWHVHISIFRDYADDPKAIKGVIDILLGVPLNQPAPAPKPEQPEEEEDVPLTDAEITKIADAVWRSDMINNIGFADGSEGTRVTANEALIAIRRRLGQVPGAAQVAAAVEDADAAEEASIDARIGMLDAKLDAVLASQAAADRGEREEPEPPA